MYETLILSPTVTILKCFTGYAFENIKCLPTELTYPGSLLDTVIESSGIPPLIKPRSPTGLQSSVDAKPCLHLQENEPGVLTHSVDATSHWLLTHSFISVIRNRGLIIS